MLKRLLPILLLAITCRAQVPLFDANDKSMTPPKVIHSVDPKYPRPHGFFNKLKAKGSVVTVELIVDTQGLPQDLKIQQTGGDEFDKAAIDAVSQYRFAPAQRNGEPVSVRLRVQIVFKVY